MGVNALDISEFTHPDIYSFEESIFPAVAHENSQLTISDKHYKHLKHSLKWQWNKPAAQWSIKQPVLYQKKNEIANDNSVSTFVFWIYSSDAFTNEKIKIEFLKQGEVCCFFEYGIDFQGWRGAWVAFDRDMQGTAQIDMDEMRITAPDTSSGELYFDHIILSSFQDVRHHTPDFQAPFINEKTQSHWLTLHSSWQNKFDIEVKKELSVNEKNSIRTIENRLTDLLLKEKKTPSKKLIQKRFDSYRIKENTNGSLQGLPVFFERYGETYFHLGGDNYSIIYQNSMGIKQANKLLFDIAILYNGTYNTTEKEELAQMYILLMRHLLEQGFQAGSAMGTLHHLGYSMRNYYISAFLMREVLDKANLKQTVQEAMEWFSGAGEAKKKPEIPGMDIDAFNTSLIPRLTSILMLDDTPEKAAYLYSFSRWIDNGLLYSDGTLGSFKIDGSIYHHRHNYPAYAVGGLDGAIDAVYLLNKTDFRLNQEGHENLKKALLSMRIYCNLLTWPLSLSGRHPDGTGHLNPNHFALLALCGSPDGTHIIDEELASAYLRLIQNKPTEYTNIFHKAGIMSEASPNGNWNFNYSCLSVHRRDNWSISAMGHSRYLWATESYIGANLYGRYLNHGNLQILSGGNPISNFGSGFNQHGWDWNHFPGTTAAVFPINELRADIKNLDEDSGYEEMLLSDESFAGGVSIQKQQGAFGMKLHEHDKYNGSLHARKSYFFFDNRVVALGSDIYSDLENPVHTTLFQIYLPNENFAIEVMNSQIKDFPYHESFTGKSTHVSDGINNHFFVRNGNVIVKKSLQHSFDEETDKPTQNNFSLAYINHKKAPQAGDYEYMILIQPETEELNTLKNDFTSKNKSPYLVLQKDKNAHIVFDKASMTTGYVLFEPEEITAKTDIISSTLPCLAMTSILSNEKMAFSVCDPDLRFYEGESDEIYDENGKRIERSVYSRSWIDNPSKESTIEITLKGKWELAEDSDYITIEKRRKNTTTIAVDCQHGFSRETILQKIK